MKFDKCVTKNATTIQNLIREISKKEITLENSR